MSRLALAAIIALSAAAVLRAAPDFTLPAPAEILRQIRSLPPVQPARVVAKAVGYALPDAQRTPGSLCTADDPNFQEYRYAEQIAYCRRNVSQEEKRAIAEAYGVPWEDRSRYEFDHRIPLCMGGSDGADNLWPQPLDEARVKDRLEDELCKQMRAGTLRQKDAVAQMLAWPN